MPVCVQTGETGKENGKLTFFDWFLMEKKKPNNRYGYWA